LKLEKVFKKKIWLLDVSKNPQNSSGHHSTGIIWINIGFFLVSMVSIFDCGDFSCRKFSRSNNHYIWRGFYISNVVRYQSTNYAKPLYVNISSPLLRHRIGISIRSGNLPCHIWKIPSSSQVESGT